jgi:hypothetical protein
VPLLHRSDGRGGYRGEALKLLRAHLQPYRDPPSQGDEIQHQWLIHIPRPMRRPAARGHPSRHEEGPAVSQPDRPRLR